MKFKNLKYLLLFLVILVGCFERNYQKPPVFPTYDNYKLETYTLDKDTISTKTSIYYNWYVAAKKVSLWKNFIGENVKYIDNILKYSEQFEFSYLANNTWICENNYTFDGTSGEIDLYGTVNIDSSVFWEMFFIPEEDDKIKLIEAETQRNFKSGNLIYYSDDLDEEKKLKVEWFNSDTIIIRNFYNIDMEDDYKGSFLNIKYLRLGRDDEIYRMQILFYNSKINSSSQIFLNVMDKTGGVKDSVVFGDTLFHCWNSNFMNDSCPYTKPLSRY